MVAGAAREQELLCNKARRTILVCQCITAVRLVTGGRPENDVSMRETVSEREASEEESRDDFLPSTPKVLRITAGPLDKSQLTETSRSLDPLDRYNADKSMRERVSTLLSPYSSISVAVVDTKTWLLH